MEHHIPKSMIEALLSLGSEPKDRIKNRDDLINQLAEFKQNLDECSEQSWEAVCDSLPRDERILLFKGLVYADILLWGTNESTPVNILFSRINKNCWPDTVYGLMVWAKNSCAYHEFSIGNYVFAGMMENR